jgi:hypothetical protein
MQQNGNGTDKKLVGGGRVSRIAETGFKIEGREGWFSFTKPEEREAAFEIPIAGDYIEYKYTKDAGGTWVYAINVLSRWEPPRIPLPFKEPQRRNEASWEVVREDRLIRLLEIISRNYSGRAMGMDDLIRDTILLERELLRALKRWRE